MSAPYTIVSLWDMLNLPLGRLFFTYHQLAAHAQMLAMLNVGRDRVWPRFPDRDYKELLACADEFSRLCEEVSLPVTNGAAKRVCEVLRFTVQDPADGFWTYADEGALVRSKGAIDMLTGCMRHETQVKSAMLLSPEKLHLYAPASPLFGSEVRTKFPSAIYDIDESAKCLALGRPTAAVFHAMRVMETALKAIAKCLAIPAPTNPNWGEWLKAIRSENHRRGKWAEFDQFQDYWQRIDSIKDAQRNPTLHVETTHTEEDAMLVFRAVEGFMKKLASRMDENGDPKA